MQMRILALGLLLAAMLSNSQTAINILKFNYSGNMIFAFGLGLDSLAPNAATIGGAALFSAAVPLLYLLGGSLLIVAVVYPPIETGVSYFILSITKRAFKNAPEWVHGFAGNIAMIGTVCMFMVGAPYAFSNDNYGILHWIL